MQDINNEGKQSRRQILKTTGLAAGAIMLGGPAFVGQAVAGPPDRGVVSGRANVVDIVAKHDHVAHEHQFEFSATEIPSGWTTFALDNRTEHTHFVFIAEVPQAAIDGAAAAGMSVREYYHEKITKPFQGLMDLLLGKTPRHAPVLPDWLGDVLAVGGPGLTAGGTTSMTTVDLSPGVYVAECYAKNDHNEFHSYLGMLETFTVTDEPSGAPEPRATLDLTLSNDGTLPDGRLAGSMAVDETIRPGQHTVAVHVEEQQVYEHFGGHDAHLIRLDDDTSIDDVADWMNWMDGDGLVSNDDEPSSFVGGVQTIATAGETAYIHVHLTPGDYAWVSEVPDPDERGLLVPFTVPFGRKTGRN